MCIYKYITLVLVANKKKRNCFKKRKLLMDGEANSCYCFMPQTFCVVIEKNTIKMKKKKY